MSDQTGNPPTPSQGQSVNLEKPDNHQIAMQEGTMDSTGNASEERNQRTDVSSNLSRNPQGFLSHGLEHRLRQGDDGDTDTSRISLSKGIPQDEALNERLEPTGQCTRPTTDARSGDGKKIEIDGIRIGPQDVLCGRGKPSFNHLGNKRFRTLVSSSLTEYMEADSRYEKSLVVHAIVEKVKRNGGRFLKNNFTTGKWYELNDRQAKDKVGHAVRDAVTSLENRKDRSKKRSLEPSPTGAAPGKERAPLLPNQSTLIRQGQVPVVPHQQQLLLPQNQQHPMQQHPSSAHVIDMLPPMGNHPLNLHQAFASFSSSTHRLPFASDFGRDGPIMNLPNRVDSSTSGSASNVGASPANSQGITPQQHLMLRPGVFGAFQSPQPHPSSQSEQQIPPARQAHVEVPLHQPSSVFTQQLSYSESLYSTGLNSQEHPQPSHASVQRHGPATPPGTFDGEDNDEDQNSDHFLARIDSVLGPMSPNSTDPIEGHLSEFCRRLQQEQQKQEWQDVDSSPSSKPPE